MISKQTLDRASPQLAATTASARPRLLAWRMADTSSHIAPSMLRVVVAMTQVAMLIAFGLLADAVSLAGAVDFHLIVLASLVTVGLLEIAGLSSRRSLEAGAATSAAHVLMALVLAVTAAMLGAMALDLPLVSSNTAAIWLVLTAAGLFITRLGLGLLVRRWAARGRLQRYAVIYGSGPACAEVIQAMEADPACDVAIVGIVDDRGRERAGGDVLGYPRLGTLDTAIALARKSRIDTVIVALPVAAEQRVLDILGRLDVLPAEVCRPALGGETDVRAIGRLLVRALVDQPISSWGLAAKSVFDKLVAGLALIALSPVLAAVALAVRLDSRGPVLFRQKRYGFNNELIEVFKFRSMYVDACDAGASRLVTRNDSRVTRVGRFIRKSSLDELPQLLNVLLGQLSLVGPRPHAVHAKANDRLYGEVVGRYFARHKVKPGITGWAQVNGWRGETDTEEKIVRRVEHDLYYIENWSLLLDLQILARTPLALLKTDSAY